MILRPDDPPSPAALLSATAGRLDAVMGSKIRVVFDRAAEMEAAGRRIIHLEIGRPDFDTPEVVKVAAGAALAAGRVHYGPNAGTAELREAISATVASSGGAVYDPADEVLVTVGASEAVFLAILALCDPGDEVIVPTPAWPAYAACVRLAGAVPVPVPLRPDRGFVLDMADVRDALSERTRMLVVCTPHNPTGAVVGAEQLSTLAGLLRDTRVIVLADEIYGELVYEPATHTSVATVGDLRERTLTVGGFAKAYAMDGWRLGWLAGPSELVGAALRVRQYTTTCPPTFLQDAAVVALRETAVERAQMRAQYAARRATAVEILARQSRISVSASEGAFYLYLGLPPGVSAERLAMELLEEQGVAVVPGTAFDDTGEGDGFIRIAYAQPMEDVRDGLRRIVEHVGRTDTAAPTNRVPTRIPERSS